MNTERMLTLATFLESPSASHFSMSNFWGGNERTVAEIKRKLKLKSCNTTACVGGWACILFGEPSTAINAEAARLLLDLDEWQADRLFNGVGEDPISFSVTRQEAAAFIRHMVAEEKI